MTCTTPMLRLNGLSKRYGDHLVFEGLTYSFQPGCYALNEEDNTGKSTLLNLIAGLVPADAGEIWIAGHALSQAPRQASARLAWVPDNCLISSTQTGREHLEQSAAEKNTIVDAGVLDLAGRLGLEAHLDKRFEQMSTGTRRKVFLAAAALGDPAVIIADGPSNGLDAPARAVLAEQFRLWGKDRVVLFASHDTELQRACGAQSLQISALR